MAQRRPTSFRRFHRVSGFLQEGIGLQLDLLDGLKIVEHVRRVLASDLGVKMQREAVGSRRIDELRLEGEEGLDRVELAHHGGTEDIDTRAALEEILDDIATSH